MEVLTDISKGVLEEVGAGVGTQEVICGASNYYNVFGLFF